MREKLQILKQIIKQQPLGGKLLAIWVGLFCVWPFAFLEKDGFFESFVKGGTINGLLFILFSSGFIITRVIKEGLIPYFKKEYEKAKNEINNNA